MLITNKNGKAKEEKTGTIANDNVLSPSEHDQTFIFQLHMQKESEGIMFDLFNKLDQCIICRHEFTSLYVEALPGLSIHVCEACIESAKYNFIWICLNCGKIYRRPKSLVMKRAKNPVLKEACALWEHRQIIQGIDICIECDPQGVLNFMNRESVIC